MKRNLAEARAAIQYDPTPANAGQLRQWAKDSMAQAYATRREVPEPEGHGATPGEIHAQLLDLTPWGSATQCPGINPVYWLKGVEVAEDILMDRVYKNMKR